MGPKGLLYDIYVYIYILYIDTSTLISLEELTLFANYVTIMLAPPSRNNGFAVSIIIYIHIRIYISYVQPFRLGWAPHRKCAMHKCKSGRLKIDVTHCWHNRGESK